MVKKIEGSDDRVIFWSGMQQCSRKSPEHRYFDHEASSGNRETGSASVSRFCLLVAGSVAHPHCPKKLLCITNFRLAGCLLVRSHL